MSSTAPRSTGFDIGDIVRVPFPHVERDRSAVRPALIVSRPVGPDPGLLWALMITSASHSSWPGDIPIGDDHLAYGLPVPCLIRTAKITTLAIDMIDRRLGRLGGDLLERAQQTMRTYLA